MTHGRQGRIAAWRTRATTMAVGAALRGAVALLRLAGPVRASNLAGRLTRTVGPWLRVNRVGDANLRLALPELVPFILATFAFWPALLATAYVMLAKQER